MYEDAIFKIANPPPSIPLHENSRDTRTPEKPCTSLHTAFIPEPLGRFLRLGAQNARNFLPFPGVQMGGSNRPSFVAEKANQYEQSGVETNTSVKTGFNLSVCGIALSTRLATVSRAARSKAYASGFKTNDWLVWPMELWVS